jgi:hypothetical protein
MPQATTDGPNAVISDQGMMYWRMANGRIFAANMDERDYARKVRRGFEPLERYGFYSASAYYMDHPHEPLFQAGGAKELRVDELIALGYAQRPPLVPTSNQHVGSSKEHPNHVPGCWAGAQPVVFPQLEGVEVPALLECEYCERDDLATPQALHQHQEVMHTERRQQEGLSAAIIEGLQQGGALSSGTSAEAIAAAVTATLQAIGITPQAATKRRPSAFPDDDIEEAFPMSSLIPPATGRVPAHRPKTARPEE